MAPCQARWDMGPVLRIWNDRSIVELARHTGIVHRNFGRWLRHGVPDRSADRLGIALGPGPEAIWPEWYDGTGSPAIVDYVATGVIREADHRRRQSLRSGSARPSGSQPQSDREPAIPSDPPSAIVLRLPARPSGRSSGYSDDLVWLVSVSWLATTTDPPGLPPRKESASCACSTLDDLGRPPIGWCGPTCERRPA